MTAAGPCEVIVPYPRVAPAERGIAGVVGQGAAVGRRGWDESGLDEMFVCWYFVYMFDCHQLAFSYTSLCYA